MKHVCVLVFISLMGSVFFSCVSNPGIDPADGFYFSYESRGSEYPATTRLTINGRGECSLFLTRPYYGLSTGSIDDLNWTMPGGQFDHFVKMLVDEFDFFSLPPAVEGDVLGVMDAATVWIDVSYKGQTGKIGGYNAYDFVPYMPVLQLIDDTIESIRRNAPR
jgi:hypothetical protein